MGKTNELKRTEENLYPYQLALLPSSTGYKDTAETHHCVLLRVERGQNTHTDTLKQHRGNEGVCTRGQICQTDKQRGKKRESVT